MCGACSSRRVARARAIDVVAATANLDHGVLAGAVGKVLWLLAPRMGRGAQQNSGKNWDN